jgi:hypothetical protein
MEIDGEFSFVIAINNNDNSSEIFQKIGIIAEKMQLNKPLDLFFTDTEVGNNLALVCEPFYLRK